MFETRKYPIIHNGNIQSLERKGEQEISNYALLIDNLEYSYQTNSNKLLNIKDLTGLSFGYHDQHTLSTTPDFEYDDFGNLIKDRDKKINAIVYNHSNLPLKITFDGGEVIEYVYLSNGTKFKKTVIANSVTTTTDYVDGFQYTNGVLDFFPHAEGYVKYNSNNIANIYSYVFHHSDHLGNIRLRYTRHPRTGDLAILEENHYYPFGLIHSGYNSNHQVFSFEDNIEIDLIEVTPNAADAYRYKYNGKEFQDELGLNVYDYGARIYTPDAPRFWQMDPLAEKYPSISPYVYVANNPIMYIDPDGREPIKPLVGTSVTFRTLLDNSPRKVGSFTGRNAHNYVLSLGNTKFDWKQMRPLPTQTGFFNDKKGRYIYTKKGGWVDMTHFMFYAGKAYKYKQDGVDNPIGEAVQDGYKQELTDKYAAPHSAYSYEDLPSDKYGAEFAVDYFDPESDESFGEQLQNYLDNVLQATDPNDAPNFEALPKEDTKNLPMRTNKTTTPVYTDENP